MSIIKKISERNNEQVFYKNAVVKIFAKYIKKRLCLSLFLNKNAGLLYWNFIKKQLQHRSFPVNIAKILRTSILRNICERLFQRFATWANNITSNRKWRRHFLSARWKKLAFTWWSWSFCFLYALAGVCLT